MNEDLKIYWHGVTAFHDGQARSDNPYKDRMSFDRCDWSNGWDDAEKGVAGDRTMCDGEMPEIRTHPEIVT